jgi:monoterpene epsilon-lactone hydrolase
VPSEQHEASIAALHQQASLTSLGFSEQRALYESLLGGYTLPADIQLETFELSGHEADLLQPAGGRSDRAILHLHGGGYVIGSNRIYREFGCRLSRATRLPVLIPDYRLAPENPFPAAVEDAVAAYRWLLNEGFEAPGIAIAGDSAGGGLATSMLMAVRDAGLPRPAAAVLISPWTDLQLTGHSLAPGAVDDPILNVANLARMADAYASSDLRNPLVSPLYGTVTSFPPCFIAVGTRELLLDDSRRLRAALSRAGIEADYLEGNRLIHCWPVMIPNAPESADCLERIAAFLERHLR